MHLWKWARASAILLGLSSSAMAADLGGPKQTLTPADAASLPGNPKWTACWGGVEGLGVAAVAQVGLGADGWGYGAKAGCDLQLGRFVIGAFADYDWVKLSLKNIPNSGISADTWDIGGRAGILLTPHTLAYGLISRPEVKAEFGGFSKTFDGISWGGGVEHVFANTNIAVSADYRFSQFTNVLGNIDANEHTVRLGVSYKFPIPGVQ